MVSANPPIHPEVAIIVPCYNVESCLQRAFDSVFLQTHRDLRVYAVDDGSTDNTSRILAANAHRCSYVSQANSGAAAARNRAIRMSRSPFVAFLDADDEWLPSKLERQIALFKEDPSLGLVCSLYSLIEWGSKGPASHVANAHLSAGKLFRYLVRNCFVYTSTVLVRRGCLEEAGLFNESLSVSEDFNLWLRIVARWKIACLPEVLAIAHKRPGSLSAVVPPDKRLSDGVAALEHVWSTCSGLSAAEARALQRALAERFYFLGSFLLATGANRPSRGKLAAALKLRPTYWQAWAKLGLSFLPIRASRSLMALKKAFRSDLAQGDVSTD